MIFYIRSKSTTLAISGVDSMGGDSDRQYGTYHTHSIHSGIYSYTYVCTYNYGTYHTHVLTQVHILIHM